MTIDPQRPGTTTAGRGAARGLTLIELLVALAIGSFLLIGAVTVFLQSSATFRTSNAIGRLQEDARYALDELASDIRMAGYFGLASGAGSIEGRAGLGDAVQLPPGADECGPDWALRLAAPVGGADDEWRWGCPPSGDRVAGSDTLVVRRVAPDPAAIPLAPETVYLRSARFPGSRLFVGPDLPTDGASAAYRVNRLVVNAYYISRSSSRDTAGAPVPALRRKSLRGPRIEDDEVLAGVEDMQLQFGVDTDRPGSSGRGVVDRYVYADDPLIDAASPAFLPDARILAVRVWLRLRAARPEPGHRDNRVYAYGGQRFGPTRDAFRRVVVSKTIFLRNELPAS